MQLNKIVPGFRALEAVDGPSALNPGTTVTCFGILYTSVYMYS